MNKILTIVLLVLTTSCVKMPVESIALSDAIFYEGQRMHELNLNLLNQMFDEKRQRIDDFIRMEYTPKFLEEFQARIPPETDLIAEFPFIIASIIPEINTRRDMMQSALGSQHSKLVEKLTEDFKVYENASLELRGFIESGVRLSQEKKKAFAQVAGLTKNKLDLNKIELELDNFITQSGDISLNIETLNSTINSLLNN